MFLISYSLEIIIIIMLILVMVLNLISIKTFSDKEKNSPFECGFSPKSSSRMPFSIQFFLIAIIFLIFDVEIALILPMINISYKMNMVYSFITLNFFILVLIIGLFHEWNQGALEWMK